MDEEPLPSVQPAEEVTDDKCEVDVLIEYLQKQAELTKK